MTRHPHRSHLSIALVAACVVALLPASAAATTCSYAGCRIGPCVYEDLVVDGTFDNYQCSNGWTFVGYDSRLYDQGNCTSSVVDGYHAVFYGVDGAHGAGSVFQDIAVPSYGGAIGPDEVTFYVDIQGVQASWWDRLYVRLLDPSTGEVLETITTITGNSGLNCQRVTAQVAGDYRGQTVRLSFESSIWTESSTRFVVDSVSYFHYN